MQNTNGSRRGGGGWLFARGVGDDKSGGVETLSEPLGRIFGTPGRGDHRDVACQML